MTSTDEPFAEFVRERSPALLRTSFLLCAGDRGAAEDLLQDVLERMFCRWRRIEGPPEPYARKALANAAANRWRTRSRRVAEAPLDDVLGPSEPGPEDGVIARSELMRALAQLPPKMRTVIVLRFFEDYTEEQTALALGCGKGTVKSQTSRGLTRLRELISPDLPELLEGLR